MGENTFINQMRLNGKVAIVTGAGRGLGKEIALYLASAGADIVLMARTKSQLEETAREIKERIFLDSHCIKIRDRTAIGPQFSVSIADGILCLQVYKG